MWGSVLILVLFASLARTSDVLCPPMVCSCVEKFANCSNRGLVKAPPGLPTTLKSLDVSRNELENVNTSEILSMTDLEILDMSNNLLSQLVFAGTHYKLRKLDLSSNNITTVRSLQLEGLVHLTDLNLANNKIISLPSNAFPGSSFLRSLNLKNNRLGFLDEGCMESLSSLETLILTRNFLTSFPKGLFQQMKSLLVLEVNKNKFVEIQGLTFHGLENLRVLRLKRNQIEFLMDGAFFGLSNIEELALDRNKINRVNKGWLYGLTTLRYLSLSHNNVDTVDEDAWEFCHVLDELDLRANKLQLLDRMTLSRLPNLRHLYLQDNKISHIDGGNNVDEAKTFAEVPLLETLALDGNEISHTIEDMEAPFDGLDNLKSLSLSNNLIKSIGDTAFVGLSSLEVIDVRDNVISTVQENAFQTLPRLQSIYLNSGSILCDCYLKWFPKWLNETERLHRGHVTATCAHPEQLKGQYITFVPYESYTCDDFPKPYILKQPQTQVTLHGANLVLSCRAASTSPAEMNFIWKVDSDEVEADDSPDCTERCVRYIPHSFDGKGREITAELHLSNLTYDDAGQYQCVVSNKFGVTYSERANITVYVYPTFVVTPEDIVVDAGSSATMKCAAQGVPVPLVSWTKDFGSEFPAATERRLKVNSFQPNDDRLTSVNSFIMRDAKGIDTGVYTCTAKNPAGVISWNITLSVLETPRFVKPMENKMVTEGDTAVIECMASGSPKPTLTWSKDGVKLEPTERHFFAADNQLLIMVKARMTDSGLYQCEVKNPLGTEVQNSVLTVNDFSHIVRPSNDVGGRKANNTMSVIIVTIVCCIMVTVVAWAIFFLLRQKRQHQSHHHPHQHIDHQQRRASRASFGDHFKSDGLPLTPDNLHLQKPLVVANQYTDHRPRGNSLISNGVPAATMGEIPVISDPKCLDDEDCGNVLRLPLFDPLADRLRNVINQDSSSERDSGTGDSRKSRDNLDEVDGSYLASPTILAKSADVSSSEPLVVSARNGGGESAVSLTEFEDTNLTGLDYDDLLGEDDETGCGEAILSTSNSIATSSGSCENDSIAAQSDKTSDQAQRTRVPCEPSSSSEVRFQTFRPHRSLSRDFLNNSDLQHHQVHHRSRNNPSASLKKRTSAIELNGEKYLVIEREDESCQHPRDPLSYRGGASLLSPPHKGLEVNEKLLEYSLNSTDYSMHESQLVRNSRQQESFVNSLPRRSRRRRRSTSGGNGSGGAKVQNKQKKSANPTSSSTTSQQARKDPEELYTNVPLKDDKMF